MRWSGGLGVQVPPARRLGLVRFLGTMGVLASVGLLAAIREYKLLAKVAYLEGKLEAANFKLHNTAKAIEYAEMEENALALHQKTGFSIPRILHWTYAKDLLHRDERVPLDAAEEILADNVARTALVHGDWAKDFMFWTDASCLQEASKTAYFEVFRDYLPGLEGKYRADICRGIALWEHGGLYLDVDLLSRESASQWLKPWATFVTAREPLAPKGEVRTEDFEGGFFQAVMGAHPRHPIVKAYLDVWFDHLTGLKPMIDPRGWKMQYGPQALKRAIRNVDAEFDKTLAEGTSLSVQYLQERRQYTLGGVYPPNDPVVPGEGCCCNAVVESQPGRTIFHSRVGLPEAALCVFNGSYGEILSAVGLVPASAMKDA